MKTLFNTSFFSNLWMKNKEFHSYPLNSKRMGKNWNHNKEWLHWPYQVHVLIVSLWIKALNFLFIPYTIISCHLLSWYNEFYEWVELKLHQPIHPFFEIVVFLKDSSDFFWELLLLNHLKLINSNVRGYWVFIQKHFIPLFEIKAM